MYTTHTDPDTFTNKSYINVYPHTDPNTFSNKYYINSYRYG